jgi:hypothetical protein
MPKYFAIETKIIFEILLKQVRHKVFSKNKNKYQKPKKTYASKLQKKNCTDP